VPAPGTAVIKKDDKEDHDQNLATRQVTRQVAGQVAGQVTQEVTILLETMRGEMTRAAIQVALGLKGRANFKNRYLKPALADVLIELTIPDKPTSSKQKYRLTEKGQMILRNKQERALSASAVDPVQNG